MAWFDEDDILVPTGLLHELRSSMRKFGGAINAVRADDVELSPCIETDAVVREESPIDITLEGDVVGVPMANKNVECSIGVVEIPYR